MNRTRAALLAALLAGTSASAARADHIKIQHLPRLPVTVHLIGEPSSPLCASPALREMLEAVALGTVKTSSGNIIAPDLTVRCVGADAKHVRFTVVDSSGTLLADFLAKTVPQPDGFPAAAFIAAAKIYKNPAIIESAISSYVNNVRLAYTRSALDDFDAGRWSPTAEGLYSALEAGVPPGPFYFGLYAAHAKLGHTALANWYLLCFCEHEKKMPEDLTDKQLSYLRGMKAPEKSALQAAPDLSKYERLLKEERWEEAGHFLKQFIKAEPWVVLPYNMLADSYRSLGWTELEKFWRARADIAARVENNRALRESLLKALRKR